MNTVQLQMSDREKGGGLEVFKVTLEMGPKGTES